MPAPEEGGWWDGLVASVFGKPPNSTEGLSKTPGALPGAAAEDKGKENMPAPKITVLGPVPPSQRSSTPAPSFLLGEKATARGSITDSTASGPDDEPEAPKEEPEKAKTFSMPWFNVKRVRVHAVELVGQWPARCHAAICVTVASAFGQTIWVACFSAY